MSQRRSRYLIIHNPNAGRRRRGRLMQVVGELARLGVSVEIAATERAGHATEIARASSGFDAVVAAGGDGTINEVANGMDDRPLGLIPMGTANVLAAELGYPASPAEIAQVLAAGSTMDVLPGRIDGQRFVQMASAGFDARVVAALNLGLKRRLGKLAYGVAGLIQLASGKRAPLKAVIDGVAFEAAQIIIVNGRYYGGVFNVAPDARLDRPGLHVCLFSRGDTMAVIAGVLAIALGRLEHYSGVRRLPAKQILIEGAPGEPFQLDGEAAGTLPVRITLDSNPLRLIIPNRDTIYPSYGNGP